jgi:eukaryotic-like serine/threonine-protein kinase
MVGTGEESGAGPLLKNRYQLGRVLGRGGMCIVYQAWDTRLQRNVAVKRLEPPLNEDPRTRARFDREGRALAQLSHPNLVTLVDRGSNENEDYLVFEYVEGKSLKELIREGHISIEEFGAIVGQVAEGLAAAHRAGIVHRDVKPQNILIDRQGHAKVSDFGIATGQDWTRVTRAGAIIGSARYMSPEQIRSKPVDARSDIYSLGVVMYEMLAGNPPFDGTNMPEIARLHLNAAPTPLGDVRTGLPAGLEKLVMRCLEKAPDDRFASMDELLGALVGLGLYSPQVAAEVSQAGRRSHRRGADDDRASRRASAAGPAASGPGSSRGDEDGDKRWVREHARLLERKRRAQRRWKILGTLVGAGVLALVIALIVTQTGGGGAPNVVGLTLDEAQRVAEKSGMTVEVSEKIPTFDEAEGTVLSQDPLPDAKVPDDVLNLTVSREPAAVEVASIIDVDPEGDNKQENREDVDNVVDGKDTTSWTTELYRTADFSNLKTGVGLDFTLEEEATMIRIDSPVEGWKGELLQDTSTDTTARLAVFDGKSTQIITLRDPIDSGRIWFTALALLTDSERYGVEISEIYFYK